MKKSSNVNSTHKGEAEMRREAAPKDDNAYARNSNCTQNKPPHKVEVALYSILKRGPLGIAQPEAQSLYYESALHSTISDLKNNRGIDFISEPDPSTVHYFYQKPFNRYWLATDKDREKALRLLNAYRTNRGLSKVDFPSWHTDNDKAA
ncbi:hypothetical protein [Alteromonas antoniana]|uniref:hypothetical protein n=1 Tax=Alteromonas antoniana TaxID=2803813 RepID=UPI001C48D8D6|nr:hypothetical protein [Alteromonas antoniana]